MTTVSTIPWLGGKMIWRARTTKRKATNKPRQQRQAHALNWDQYVHHSSGTWFPSDGWSRFKLSNDISSGDQEVHHFANDFVALMILRVCNLGSHSYTWIGTICGYSRGAVNCAERHTYITLLVGMKWRVKKDKWCHEIGLMLSGEHVSRWLT